MPRKTHRPAGRRAAAPDPTYTPSLGAGQASAGPAPGFARAASIPTRLLLEKVVLQWEGWEVEEAAVGGLASRRELLPVGAAVVRSPGARRKVSEDLRQRGIVLHPGGNTGANLKSISHRCYLFEVAFVWELTRETIDFPLGCLRGGKSRRGFRKR